MVSLALHKNTWNGFPPRVMRPSGMFENFPDNQKHDGASSSSSSAPTTHHPDNDDDDDHHHLERVTDV